MNLKHWWKEMEMKDVFKGLVVIVITITLFAALVGKARAGTQDELNTLLEGKVVIHNGACSLGAKSGFFEKDPTTPRVIHDCVVGVDMNEPGEIYYALIRDRRGRPVRLIKLDKDNDTQSDLWVNRPEA